MKKNKGRPPKLRIARTPIVAFATALLLFPLHPTPAAAGPVQIRQARLQVGTEAWQLFKATNDSRAQFGLPALRLDREISQAVRRHSMAMARADRLFHTSEPNVYLEHVEWHAWGENVGFTSTGVSSLDRAFMKSSSHREHILSTDFRHVAIGAVRVDGTLWVTVFFYG